MKNTSVESQVYILIIVTFSLGMLFWLLLQPESVGPTQPLILAAAIMAILLELSSPPLPHFGSVSTASAFYIFMIASGGTQTAALSALLGTSLRIAVRERGPALLRVFSPFQRLLSIGVASLPLYLFVGKDSAQFHDWVLAACAPLYFVFDALTEGTAVGLTLEVEEQKRWFRGRYKTLLISLIPPFVGVAASFLSKSAWPALGILFLIVFLLQFSMAGAMEREVAEVNSPILDDLDKVRDDLRTAERRYEEMRRQVAQKTFELGLLLDFGRAIGSNLTLDYAFEVILDILKKLFRYQSCIIFFADSAGSESILRPKRFFTPYENYFKNLHIRFGETIVGMSAKEQRAYLVDSRRRPEFSPLIENERSEMAVPLIAEDRVKGVIYVGNPEEGAYADTDLQLLTTIAYQAAIVLIYAESYEYTVALATTDGLTLLYTHRYFQERLLEEVKRSERYHQPLSLIMLDLDHFKEYNDAYGHPVGDSLLKNVSQILKDCTRESDIVCRYGGDEFAILLLETTKETTLSIAKRIREAVELRVNLNPSSVKITTSIGVASFPEDASNKSDLLKEADKALYESKNSGRNRVVAARKSY